MMNDEMKGYIERAVADIARKCSCKQDEVWERMYTLSMYNSMKKEQ